MTLQEAIKSGRSFRREAWRDSHLQLWIEIRHGAFLWKEIGEEVTLVADDILATDWIVEEERRELTWGEISSAINQHLPRGHYIDRPNLKHALGFSND